MGHPYFGQWGWLKAGLEVADPPSWSLTLVRLPPKSKMVMAETTPKSLVGGRPPPFGLGMGSFTLTLWPWPIPRPNGGD
jgi:hypothetical protein